MSLPIVILMCWGLILFIVERFAPLRKIQAALIGRLIINVLISAATFGTAMLVVKPAAAAALRWSTSDNIGLIAILPLSHPVKSIVAFLLMDLTFYYWHRVNHAFPFLWRFHNVHHTDPDLDVSTAFRFHFGEVAFSALFRIAQILLIGVSGGVYAAYELIFQANTFFHHSNMRLPIRLERILNTIFVTPRMHGVHHSQVRSETNSNYAVVFPWWDRWHRTLRLNIPQNDIKIGVPGYAQPQDNRLWYLLILPFLKQRDYWRNQPEREPQEPPDTGSMIE